MSATDTVISVFKVKHISKLRHEWIALRSERQTSLAIQSTFKRIYLYWPGHIASHNYSLFVFFRLCKAVDDKLAATLEDTQYFIMASQQNKHTRLSKRTSMSRVSDLSFLSGNKTVINDLDPFDRFGDSQHIQSFLQETCFSAFNQ